MQEGFDTSVYQTLSDTQAAAVVAYLNQSSGNPDAAQFASTNATALKAQLTAAKANSYTQAETDLARVQDQTANLKLYQTRTNDIDGLMTQINKNNEAVLGQLTEDKAVTKRQFEINEWYNYRKKVTANALMNLTIVMGLLVIVVAAWKFGGLPSGAFYGSAAVLVLYGGVSTWYRFSDMASPGQDAILWHRRRFGPATPPPPKQKCDPLTGELISPTVEVNPCLEAAAKKLAALVESNTQDIESYLQGTSAPKALCTSSQEDFTNTAG
jgi:hypothetical protein